MTWLVLLRRFVSLWLIFYDFVFFYLFLFVTGHLVFTWSCSEDHKHRHACKVGTVKVLKNSDTQKVCFNHSKSWTRCLCLIVVRPKDADGMANSVDGDQEQSDLCLGYLPRPVCPKTLDHYDTWITQNSHFTWSLKELYFKVHKKSLSNVISLRILRKYVELLRVMTRKGFKYIHETSCERIDPY